MREYSDAAVIDLALQLAGYLEQPDNLGASRWLDERAIGGDDRAAVLVALADQERRSA